MANQNQLYPQNWIPPEQIGDDVLGVPEDVQKLRLDALSVLEGTVPIDSFDSDYQKLIKDYYRYSALRYGSKYGAVAKRTINTLDAV